MARAALLSLLLVVGCGGNGASPAATDTQSPLPPSSPAPPGWIVAEGPAEYAPGTLYEYMNGGAERYESYGFRKLVHTRYQLGDDPLACVGIDLYDMGSPLGAFGIYAAGRPGELEPRDWGSEGYRDGVIAAAYKASVFIHGEADDERPELTEVLERLMTDVLAGVRGDASPPAILGLLPTRGRVALSERYVSVDLLGHSFLPGGVLAAYEFDGLRDELFFSDLEDPAAAADALNRLADALEQQGATVERTTNSAIEFTDRFMGSGTAVATASHVAGSFGELDTEARERILTELTANLQEPAIAERQLSGTRP